MSQLPESERLRLGIGQSPISLSVTECLHRVGRAIYGDAWIAGLTPIERARMIQYPRGEPLPNDPGLRAEIERIRDRDELARVERDQARKWIAGSGFNTGPGTFNDQEAFERALARDYPAQAAPYPLPALQPTATAETTPRRVQIATKRDKLSSWIAEQYPQGIPAGTTAKAIAQEFRGATNISVGERTVRRALGRK